MTSFPLPREPSTNENPESARMTPVLALKELVARLHKEQNKLQDLLSSLGFALRSFNNLNQFLEIIPLMATRVTDADASALILFKANGQVGLERLHCQEDRVSHQIRQAIDLANRQILAATSTTVKLPLIQTSFDSQISRNLAAGIQMFSTPILIKNIERGRLYVFSTDPEYSWTETRQKLVRLVADQTAVAIANNELTAELRKKERLDQELEIAAEIQLRLLPRQCPQIPGVEIAARCQNANRVGGDYYDFIPDNFDQLRSLQHNIDDRAQWSIVIGDVMGKGVPAGLIMTMTRGMLRTEVLNGHSPGQILQHLNRVMYADLETSHRFVTLFYSRYNPQSQTLAYSNAAHNPPLLWQAGTKSVKRLDTAGMLIGLDADSQYEDSQIQLTLGDIIIYYTDGLTDAVNQQGDRFDEDNLCRYFELACQNCDSAQGIVDYLFDRIHDFTGNSIRPHDDMTLVVMRVGGNSKQIANAA
jgi:phosphoserine phosphatase RsbU/P